MHRRIAGHQKMACFLTPKVRFLPISTEDIELSIAVRPIKSILDKGKLQEAGSTQPPP
jgi:hypothetical protein